MFIHSAVEINTAMLFPTMHDMLSTTSPLELLWALLIGAFAVFLLGAALCEVYPLAEALWSGMISIAQTVQDFVSRWRLTRQWKARCSTCADSHQRNGVFYNPFGKGGIVIIRDVEAFHELSENPNLSQRAAYSEVA